MSDDRDLQRDVTTTILGSIADHGFVLAGSGAIREHGIVDRLTHDVDLFTNRFDADLFAEAIAAATSVLESAGYSVAEQRRAELFAHLDITAPDGRQIDVDFGYDWRGREPAQLQVGPVLSADDAVASKVGAVYTRGEVRDFIDLDAIRSSGRYTDGELLALVADRDEGFDRAMFAEQLGRVRTYAEDRFNDYGYDPHQAHRVRDGALAWAAALREQPPAADEDTAGLVQRHAADLPKQPTTEAARLANDQRDRDQREHTVHARAAQEVEQRIRDELVRRQQDAAVQRVQEQQRRGPIR